MANLPTDKIVLDVSDSPELKDYFSRKEAGETCSGKFEATLDEAGEKTVILSIDDIQLHAGKSKKAKAPAKKSAAEEVMEIEMEGEEEEGESY